MSANTSIQWCDRTWNPIRGCSVISEGCINCYAMKMAHRFSGPGKPYVGLTKQTKSGPQWTGKIAEISSALYEPIRWKKPQRIFVNSMSDLFHESVRDEFILQVFTVMAIAKHHTFQVLTKRPERMQQLLSEWRADDLYTYWHGYSDEPAEAEAWPLPNVQLGVSVEAAPQLWRVNWLKDTPAAVRFISGEPLLEDLGPMNLSLIDWFIVGGESGPSARDCDVQWIQNIVRQCRQQNVAPFVKQLGSRPGALEERRAQDAYGEIISDDIWHPLELKDRKGGEMAEWPKWLADLQVREFPSAVRA